MIRTASPGSSVPYKFTMNGVWEMGDNRGFTLAASAQTLPVDYFDRIPDLGTLAIVPGPFHMTLSWTAGPGIRLQTSSDPTREPWLDVPDTLGQASVAVPFDPLLDPPAFFRLTGP